MSFSQSGMERNTQTYNFEICDSPSLHSHQALSALTILHLIIADFVITFSESTGSSSNHGLENSMKRYSVDRQEERKEKNGDSNYYL